MYANIQKLRTYYNSELLLLLNYSYVSSYPRFISIQRAFLSIRINVASNLGYHPVNIQNIRDINNYLSNAIHLRFSYEMKTKCIT